MIGFLKWHQISQGLVSESHARINEKISYLNTAFSVLFWRIKSSVVS